MTAPIGVGLYQRATDRFRGLGLYLIHLCFAIVAALRRVEPHAFILGRFDPGRDGSQCHFDWKPADAAKDFAERYIKPFVLGPDGKPNGLFSAVCGINEAFPGRPKREDFDSDGAFAVAGNAYLVALQWRADFELALCRIVQGWGIAYVWGGVNTGALDADVIHLFLPVILEAWAVNYHAYLAEGRRSICEEPRDQWPWHAWRPLEIWWPELQRLGVNRLRIILGELGPFYPILHGEDLARCQIEIHRAFRARAAQLPGVEYIGAAAYGEGLMDDQRPWELEGGPAGLLPKANTDDGAAPSAPVLSAPALPADSPGGKAMTKTPPTGFGWWIWYADKALGRRTPAQFADVCLSRRISHVFIKAGDGAKVWDQFAAVVEPLKAAGLRVYSWSYCYGDDWGAEADVALAALAAGSDGHVFDVEGECEGKGGSVLRTLEAVRERWPTAWLATAPLPVIDLHEPSLYDGSAKYVDAFLPQFYWKELGPKYGNLDALFGAWRDHFPGKALMPVGQAYGDAQPEEIIGFVKRARAEGCSSVSFWEWTASTDEQWQTVADQAVAAVPVKPEPISEPPAGPEPGVTWEQVSLAGHWMIARAANREDPRDREAFAAHVGATGGDPSDLGRYGWPR